MENIHVRKAIKTLKKAQKKRITVTSIEITKRTNEKNRGLDQGHENPNVDGMS